MIQFSHGGSKKLEEIMKNRILLEINSDCRASSSWHPDGAYSLGLTVILIITIVTSNFSNFVIDFFVVKPNYRPAELQRPNLQKPGVV